MICEGKKFLLFLVLTVPIEVEPQLQLQCDYNDECVTFSSHQSQYTSGTVNGRDCDETCSDSCNDSCDANKDLFGDSCNMCAGCDDESLCMGIGRSTFDLSTNFSFLSPSSLLLTNGAFMIIFLLLLIQSRLR